MILLEMSKIPEIPIIGNAIKDHFTHEPRALTMKLREPKENVQRLSQGTSKVM